MFLVLFAERKEAEMRYGALRRPSVTQNGLKAISKTCSRFQKASRIQELIKHNKQAQSRKNLVRLGSRPGRGRD